MSVNNTQHTVILGSSECTAGDLICRGASLAAEVMVQDAQCVQSILSAEPDMDPKSKFMLDQHIENVVKTETDTAVMTAQRILKVHTLNSGKKLDMTTLSPAMIRIFMEQAAFTLDNMVSQPREKVRDDSLYVAAGRGQCFAEWIVAWEMAKILHGMDLDGVNERMAHMTFASGRLLRTWSAKALECRHRAAAAIGVNANDPMLVLSVPDDASLMAAWQHLQADR